MARWKNCGQHAWMAWIAFVAGGGLRVCWVMKEGESSQSTRHQSANLPAFHFLLYTQPTNRSIGFIISIIHLERRLVLLLEGEAVPYGAPALGRPPVELHRLVVAVVVAVLGGGAVRRDEPSVV